MALWYVPILTLYATRTNKIGGKILTHSYSRVVMQTLLLAHKQKRISVYVTEARPRGSGSVLLFYILQRS